MTGMMLDELEALDGVRERFAPCKQLRATLYGETTLCQDERAANKQLVVLKRVSLALLRANATHARENPARERDVIDALRKNGGHAHVVAYAEPQALFKLMAPSTVELLAVMLQVEPCTRVGVHQVLEHPALSAFRKA
ncbi:hypothetical protein PybrP1_012268 [[Pythium] brassicae (nom. inval.)]|nr:hypothetical protein PybrP1_012268 [[Pythium] brassicae (nom. inval.)]